MPKIGSTLFLRPLQGFPHYSTATQAKSLGYVSKALRADPADTPTRRHADTPTRRHADTPTRRQPTRRHADTPPCCTSEHLKESVLHSSNGAHDPSSRHGLLLRGNRGARPS